MKETKAHPFYRSTSGWLVVFVVLFVSVFSVRRGWKNLITWDVAGYYAYLPALFIDHDIRLEHIDRQEELRLKYDFSSTLYQFHPIEGSANYVNQYSYGMALAMSPAFFVGHVTAGLFGFEQDGYTWPYQLCLWLWSLFWMALGIFQIRKVLLHFFSEGVTSWLMLILFFGTHYLHNVPGTLAVSHSYLFTNFVFFLTAVIQWHEQNTLRSWLKVCLIGALAAVCRPSEILWMLLPLFWGVTSLTQFGARLYQLFIRQWSYACWGALVFFVIAFPQFFYWKIVTGHWLYMSYTNPGEGFDFTHPYTLSFLFSARKGWFIYTPIMALGAVAIFAMFKTAREYAWAFLAFFALNLYLVSSWTTWWYAQCFSQRAMVQTLPLYMLAIGFLWQSCKSVSLRRVIYSLSAILALVGLWFTFLYNRSVIHMDRMTPQYLSHVFYRWNATSEFDHLLLVDHNSQDLPNFDDPNLYYRRPPIILGSDTILLNAQKPFLGLKENPYHEFGAAYHYGVKIEAEVWMDSVPSAEEILLVGQIAHKEKPYGYRTTGFKPAEFVPGQWNSLSVYYLTPEMRSREDVFKCFVWYRGQREVKVRSRSVTIYEPIFQP